MTNEEAKEILIYNKEMCLFNPMTGESVPMNKECEESAKAFNIAIKALEKQMPKKVDLEQNIRRCPNCNEKIYYDTVFGQQHPDCCTECGQRLDWGEEW